MTLYDKILVKIKNAEFLKQERGTIFVLTALLLPLMFGFLGFAYDVGNLYMHKARLQNTADAAVLAGARAYINKLGENAVNDIATNATDNQKAAAKPASFLTTRSCQDQTHQGKKTSEMVVLKTIQTSHSFSEYAQLHGACFWRDIYRAYDVLCFRTSGFTQSLCESSSGYDVRGVSVHAHGQ